MTLTFGIDQVRVYAADPRYGEQPLPEADDLVKLIGTAGDRFRDAFTRMCLYATRSSDADTERSCDTVIVGTEYGNAEALARLQRDALALGRRLSPQAFPQAISGAAAASVAMATGATGANMTLGANLLTPVLAFWQAHATVDRSPAAVCRLLVGDLYSDEARTDASRHEPTLDCRSGMAHAVLTRGDEFSAVFDFTPATAETSPGHRILDEANEAGEASKADEPETTERNGAFALGRFLQRVIDLPVGASAVLECSKSPSQRATVRVTRVAEPERSER
ncbi:hypothetical protein AB0P21_00940 [Kribbella sp. NPDC056861]|uniref:hypothetical protein n=1 Tax=Kribbella sp. NPDC056861 TaxID=3154857 RepID=UPI00343C5250